MFRTSLLKSRLTLHHPTMSLIRPFSTTPTTYKTDQMPVRRVGKISVEKDPNAMNQEPSPGERSSSDEQVNESAKASGGHPTGDPKDSPSANSPSAGQPKGKGGVDPNPPR